MSVPSFLATSDSTLVKSISQGAVLDRTLGSNRDFRRARCFGASANNAAVAPTPPTTSNAHSSTLSPSDSPTSGFGTGNAWANLDDRIAPILVFAASSLAIFL
ncbi:hypothetical protein MVEN_00898400 [Mycena venus]|uniref:Uncharacterized protein n=1 Tax=Mycena venus TaxID=2733690 RepID=A0A8H7D1E9_9AGAR|nr:hypothetical protein MVEN_00898400 [Mycena venus]